MIRVAEMRKDLALQAYGSIWYVDSANNMLRENLGQSRPAFQLGDSFASPDEAAAAGYGHFTLRPLPDVIKVPNQSPIIDAERHRTGNHPLTRLTFLITDDLINKGIRLEDRLLSAVDFSLPPPELLDLLDLIPTAIHAKGDPDLKVAVSYQRDGDLKIVGNPMIRSGIAFSPWTKAMAFFHRVDGEREADGLAKQLVHAADWRSREVTVPLIRDAEAA